ncbi:hypothetical protein SVIOM74S_02418 [Streptomyces violarus]
MSYGMRPWASRSFSSCSSRSASTIRACLESKWYCTTRSDTLASAAILRMLAASSPCSAAIRHTASAIRRRCRARMSVGRGAGGLSGAGSGCRRRR